MFSGVLESFTSLMSARSENKTLKKLHIFIIFNKNNLSENSRSSQNLLLDKFHLIVGNYPKLPPRMPTKCQLRAKGSWVSFQTQLRAKSQTQLCTINSIFPSSWHFQLPQPTQTQLSTTIISNSEPYSQNILYLGTPEAKIMEMAARTTFSWALKETSLARRPTPDLQSGSKSSPVGHLKRRLPAVSDGHKLLYS